MSSTTTHTTPAEVLRAAALYLTRHGWHQGDFYARHDTLTAPACVEGAIGIAALGRQIDHAWGLQVTASARQALAMLRDYLASDAIPDDTHTWNGVDLAAWNDTPGRTAADITNALNSAADYGDRIRLDGGNR